MSSSRLSRFVSVAFSVSLRSLSKQVLSLALPAILLASFHSELQAQTNEWRWVTGSSTDPANGSYEPGVLGSQGVGAAANTPGSAVSPVSWTDANGNLWLFGGVNGAHTELWKIAHRQANGPGLREATRALSRHMAPWVLRHPRMFQVPASVALDGAIRTGICGCLADLGMLIRAAASPS